MYVVELNEDQMRVVMELVGACHPNVDEALYYDTGILFDVLCAKAPTIWDAIRNTDPITIDVVN